MNSIFPSIISKGYSDFGETSTSGGGDRLGYIADDCLVAENDIESDLGDFGVGKYKIIPQAYS